MRVLFLHGWQSTPGGLKPTYHPLALEQREGITMARVREIAEALLHPKDTIT